MSTSSIFTCWPPKKKEVNTCFSMGWAALLQNFSNSQIFYKFQSKFFPFSNFLQLEIENCHLKYRTVGNSSHSVLYWNLSKLAILVI